MLDAVNLEVQRAGQRQAEVPGHRKPSSMGLQNGNLGLRGRGRAIELQEIDVDGGIRDEPSYGAARLARGQGQLEADEHARPFEQAAIDRALRLACDIERGTRVPNARDPVGQPRRR